MIRYFSLTLCFSFLLNVDAFGLDFDSTSDIDYVAFALLRNLFCSGCFYVFMLSLVFS